MSYYKKSLNSMYNNYNFSFVPHTHIHTYTHPHPLTPTLTPANYYVHTTDSHEKRNIFHL